MDADHRALREHVREHYDTLLSAYSLFWGEHIHHGYWDGPASPRAAQERLTRELACYAGVPRGARVADIGCGIGGSTRWLTRHLGCRVTPLSISFRQLVEARRRGPAGLPWLQADAAALPLRRKSHDAVWVVECSEHLPDLAGFFRECARVTRPGGVLALASWLRAPGADSPLVRAVEEGMLIAPLRPAEECLELLGETGWTEAGFQDVTPRVQSTWELCRRVTAQPMVQALLRGQPEPVRRFVDSFAAIHRAYADGVMRYGFFRAGRASDG